MPDNSTSHSPASPYSNPPLSNHLAQDVNDDPNQDDSNIPPAVFKGPKRKRLVKACDACHKSKRRCDGTAPCGNCYYASKECRYTDAAGRTVPAPNSASQEPPAPSNNPPLPATGSIELRPQTFVYASRETSHPPPSPLEEHAYDSQGNPRKRLRWEHDTGGFPVPSNAFMPPIRFKQNDSEPDPSLTRELINLFFTHCHPHRLIIHLPTFNADLALDRVPAYLLNTICALAAPLCRNPQLRATPHIYAGRPFAEAAQALMYDSAGHLIAPSCLATAQALCFLQMHEMSIQRSVDTGVVLFDHALRILDELGVQKPYKPILSPLPSAIQKQRVTEQECIRRAYWLIQLTEMLASIFTKRPVTSRRPEPRICLPCSETCFELSNSYALEFLHVPSPNVHFSSEFGHLIRVASIFSEIQILDADNAPDPRLVAEYEAKLGTWYHALAEQLTFSEDTMHYQLSMWETSSNTSAWCFFFMHVLHACCLLAICDMKRDPQRGPIQQWAVERITHILSSLGLRARNSILMGVVLRARCTASRTSTHTALDDYSMQSQALEPRLEAWLREYEDLWGIAEIDAGEPSRRQHSHNLHRQSLATSFSQYSVPSPPQPSSSPPGQYPSLSRSIGEMHLQGPTARSFEDRRVSAESDQIASRQWGSRDGRSEPILPSEESWMRDGPSQLLPSLKASGLLDRGRPLEPIPSSLSSRVSAPSPAASWLSVSPGSDSSSTIRRAASESTSPGRHTRSHQPAAVHSRTHSQSHTRQPPAHLQPSDRPASTLPVGLPWLARESRQ